MSTKYKKPDDVPNKIISERLYELADLIRDNDKDCLNREFTMRIPAELDRDPDLVMLTASKRILDFEKENQALKEKIIQLDFKLVAYVGNEAVLKDAIERIYALLSDGFTNADGQALDIDSQYLIDALEIAERLK